MCVCVCVCVECGSGGGCVGGRVGLEIGGVASDLVTVWDCQLDVLVRIRRWPKAKLI